MINTTKEALEKLFKPGKVRILDKIHNNQPLTDTELMYYYRSIRPTILATQNTNLQNYLKLVDSSRKHKLVPRNS